MTFRPYENKTDEYLIEELKKLNSSKGIFFPIAFASLIVALFWKYSRLAFWITIVLITLYSIFEIVTDDSRFDKKKLIEKELKFRR